jgi:hypothetical protein
MRSILTRQCQNCWTSAFLNCNALNNNNHNKIISHSICKQQLNEAYPSTDTFVAIGGTNEQSVGCGANESGGVDRLMRRAVLAEADRIVRHHIRHSEMRQCRQSKRRQCISIVCVAISNVKKKLSPISSSHTTAYCKKFKNVAI